MFLSPPDFFCCNLSYRRCALQPPPPGYEEDESDEAEDSDDSSDGSDSSSSDGSDDSSSDSSEEQASSDSGGESAEGDKDAAAAAAAKESLEHYAEARKEVLASQSRLMSNGGCMLRSKGFCWLASCPERVVEWSSSGLLLEVAMSHPWFCTLPKVGRRLSFIEAAAWTEQVGAGSLL